MSATNVCFDMAAASRTELADRFGVPVSMLYLWCRESSFPPSVGFESPGGQRGRPAELWDADAVGEWIEQHRDRASATRWEAARVEARRLRAEGMAVLDIAPTIGMSVSFVRRVTEDVPATPTRSLRPHPWTYSDAEIVGALEASGATTAYGYGRWRNAQPEPRPSSAAIIKRYGTWKAALAASQRRRAAHHRDA